VVAVVVVVFIIVVVVVVAATVCTIRGSTTHPHLVQRLRMSGAKPPRFVCPIVASTGATDPSYLSHKPMFPSRTVNFLRCCSLLKC
jgi:hypothetical protein